MRTVATDASSTPLKLTLYWITRGPWNDWIGADRSPCLSSVSESIAEQDEV